MYGTILTFIKINNFDICHLDRSSHLFHSFLLHYAEPLCVYEPSFNTDKYGNRNSFKKDSNTEHLIAENHNDSLVYNKY